VEFVQEQIRDHFQLAPERRLGPAQVDPEPVSHDVVGHRATLLAA
jgi:hypothetical protein